MMNNQPLLAVIVACYNLEQYVDKCVSSIVAQTYSNLEILLIDDGSTDQTGERCDLWQEYDPRIRVIHKQNEGLSYVRKTGIENTKAEYVTFIDVDDWISPDMYADMMSALLSTNSDIAQCGFTLLNDETAHPPIQKRGARHEIVNREEGVLLILEDKKWRSFLWNKIFKKHLFDHVMFQKDLNLGEDFISLDLFHHASQSVYLPDEYYYYIRRKGSMVNANNISSKLKMYYDFSRAFYSRYLFVEQHPQYHCALPIVKFQAVNSGIILLHNLHLYPKYYNNDYFKDISKQICSIPFTRKDKLKRSLKIQLFILRISPKLYMMMKTLYVKMINQTKINYL